MEGTWDGELENENAVSSHVTFASTLEPNELRYSRHRGITVPLACLPIIRLKHERAWKYILETGTAVAKLNLLL